MRINQLLCSALLAIGLQTVVAEDPFNHETEGSYIGDACVTVLSYTAAWCPKVRGMACACTNVDYAGTFFHCGLDNARNEKEKREFREFIKETCINYTDSDITKIYENSTKYLVNVTDIPNFNFSLPIHTPVNLNHTLYKLALKSQINFYNNYHLSFFYGAALTAYFPVLFFLGGLLHWGERLFPNTATSIKRIVQQNFITQFLRKHVFLPATFNGVHARQISYIQGILPTRWESMVIFVWSAVCFVFHFTNYGHYFQGNTVYSSSSAMISRSVGGRSGIISTYLIIVAYFLAGRNNIFLWWTGWKQSTFLAYHKAVARASMISALVHTIAYLIYYIIRGSYKTSEPTYWWIWGSVAMVAGCIMLVQAIGALRSANYELFLYIHIIMAVLVVVGCYYHLEAMNFLSFVYALIAVWAFDRFFRIVRVLSFGVRTAKVTAVSNDVLEILVPKHQFWSGYPGAFGYVYFMRTSLFWQSHPFSIISAEDGKHLKFYVKVKRGATETIMKYVRKQDGNTADLKVLFEGPYGSYQSMNHFDNAIFYSSGNGVPAVYPFVRDCLDNSNSKVQFVKLYWVVQTFDSVKWFYEELKTLQRYNNLETIIYVTRHELSHAITESSSSEEMDQKQPEKEAAVNVQDLIEHYRAEFPQVEFRLGRPNMDELVREDAAATVGSDVCIMSCGHAAACDQVRTAVADVSGSRSSGALEFIEEVQVW